MPPLSHVPAKPFAAACAALGWPTDAIAALLSDLDGHGLGFDSAYDLAWHVRDTPRSDRRRREAHALLTEFGLPLTPQEMPKGQSEPLIRTDDEPPFDMNAEIRSGAIYWARMLVERGHRESEIARALVREHYLAPALAAEAAAIAVTDPHIA